MKRGQRDRKLHYGWIIVALSVATTVSAIGFARFGYTVLLPGMKQGLDLSAVQAADLATGNMIGYLALSVIGGLLASRFGARRIIALFLLLTGASLFLTGLAAAYPAALAARILAGLGSGGANIPVMALVAIWFVPRRRGLATGIAVSGASIGLAITGLLGPALLRCCGPGGSRHTWFILAALTLAIALLAWLFLRDRPSELGLLPVGGMEGAATARSAPPPAAAAAPALLRDPSAAENRERRAPAAPAPLQWSRLYRSPPVWHLAAIYVLFGFSYVIYATFFVHYLTAEAGFSLQRAGSLWSLVGLVSMASGFIWGTVSDRLGRKYGLALVYGLQAASFCLFGLWRQPAGIYLSALLFALTAWSIPAIMAASAGDALGPRLAAAAFGFISVFLSIGQALGPFAAGRIANATGSYSAAFLIAAAAALAGAAAALALRRELGGG